MTHETFTQTWLAMSVAFLALTKSGVSKASSVRPFPLISNSKAFLYSFCRWRQRNGQVHTSVIQQKHWSVGGCYWGVFQAALDIPRSGFELHSLLVTCLESPLELLVLYLWQLPPDPSCTLSAEEGKRELQSQPEESSTLHNCVANIKKKKSKALKGKRLFLKPQRIVYVYI